MVDRISINNPVEIPEQEARLADNNECVTSLPPEDNSLHQKADEIKKQEQQRMLTQHLSRIKHKIMVLSGKGGVGKSTVAVNLALAETIL